jgi:hypothetical protein
LPGLPRRQLADMNNYLIRTDSVYLQALKVSSQALFILPGEFIFLPLLHTTRMVWVIACAALTNNLSPQSQCFKLHSAFLTFGAPRLNMLPG